MIVDFERTRFLGQLDTMLMQDRQGAIDDMLQVLREVGAIRQAYVTASMNDHYLHENTASGYRDHMKREAADRIGNLLLNDGVLRFKEEPESPGRTTLTGSAFFVVP